MSKEEAEDPALKYCDARINKLVDEVARLTKELAEEKAVTKAFQDHVNEIDDFEIAYLDTLDKRKKH